MYENCPAKALQGWGKMINSVYKKSEEDACKLLNSKKLNHIWKRDFKLDNSTEKWDLINSDGIKIEVKSTVDSYKFNFNSISPNLPEQRDQIILKLLLTKDGENKRLQIC